ncbi:transmembrane protein 131 [Arapaima gigas]
MANRQTAHTFSHLSVWATKTTCLRILRLLFIALFQVAQADKQAFIQSDTILEVLHFGEGSLLPTESDMDLNSYHQKSTSLHRGNCRPIRFEPPMLDFHEQPVGMPKMEKVFLHNPTSKARKPFQCCGKITVKAKEKSYSKLEIPYQAEVLEGYLGFDHTATLFHIRDSPTDPVERAIFLTNTFNFAIQIHNVSLPEEAKTMFGVQNFSRPILIPPHESRNIFTLSFRPVRPSIHIDSNILLVTNASRFHLPIRAYTGFLEPVVLPPSLEEHFLDFGVLSASDISSLIFVVINSNPIEVKSEPGVSVCVCLSVCLQVILASGYYAVFRVTLVAKDLEGIYDGAVHITTDYEILTIPVKAVIAVGTLTSSPKHIVLPPSFPGKVVHQSLNIMSSFSQRVKLQHIQSLTEDVRFYYRKLRNNKDELEPKRKSKVANIYFDASLQCGDHCYVGLPFFLKVESKLHGLLMQENMWDADIDVHQTLLRRWRELKENSGYEVEVVFEVNTDLQKNVQAKVTAQMTWPSIINSSRQILFPLTNINSSSEEVVVLENPADIPVYVQVLPVALYPNPSTFAEKLADSSFIETFCVVLQTSITKGAAGFVEGQTRPHVCNLLLLPHEVKSFTVQFNPVGSHTVTSLLIVRNNLTVLDYVMVQGQGTTESLKVAGKAPGPGSSLRFKMTESLLKDCTDDVKSKEPNFTLRRTFKLENTGQLPIIIQSMEISGYACEGFGFKVLNCQEFALKPNASKDIVILFTPDFTASRVIRELKLVTAGGSEFVFVLNASLPYHMLALCAEALPRPSWELQLYIIISLIMSSMFLLVIATAYLEAQGIWEPFRRGLSFEASNTPMETGRPFDLREIVRLQTDANEYGDANHNSTQGMYGSGGATSRANTRQGAPQAHSGSRPPMDLEGVRSRVSSSRASMQTASTFVTKGSSNSASGSSPDTAAVAPCQLTNRRARSTRQCHQTQPQQQSGPSEQPPHIPAVPLHLQKAHPEGGARHSSEDSDYTSLLDAMDKDLDRPESPAVEVFQEHPPSPAGHNKGKVQPRKTKAQKKREEKERQIKGRSLCDDLKEVQADNDDSSSTTTETSNPDVETAIKEKKGQPIVADKEKEELPIFHKSRNKKPSNVKKEVQTDAKTSSLELPYVTPLENKQRKNFPAKGLMHPTLASGQKTKATPKQRVVCGKPEDCRSPPMGKYLAQEPGNSSSSEGEKDSPPPEWASVTLLQTGSSADSLQQISLQTMNADPFLKRPIADISRACSPPPTTLGTRGTYSSVVNANSMASAICSHGAFQPDSVCVCACTCAAVLGGSGLAKGVACKTEPPGKMSISHTTSVESDCSDSSGLWSPTDSINSQNFNPFGPNNTFNLSGVFRGMTYSKSQEPQQNWPEFSSVSPSFWETPSGDPLHSWPSSSSSPTTSTASILGNTSSLWSSTTPFSNSIWSTSGDSSLHSLSPTSTAPLSDLMGVTDSSATCSTLTQPTSPVPDIGRTYNPWSMWRPTLVRRSSEPWPNSSNKSN